MAAVSTLTVIAPEMIPIFISDILKDLDSQQQALIGPLEYNIRTAEEGTIFVDGKSFFAVLFFLPSFCTLIHVGVFYSVLKRNKLVVEDRNRKDYAGKKWEEKSEPS